MPTPEEPRLDDIDNPDVAFGRFRGREAYGMLLDKFGHPPTTTIEMAAHEAVVIAARYSGKWGEVDLDLAANALIHKLTEEMLE